MFDGMSKKLAEKMGRSVKEAAEPIKAEMKKVTGNKVDLYSRILRLGVLILLFVDGTRRVSNLADPGKDHSPNQIVINNYIDTHAKPPYGNGRNRQEKGR